MIVCGDEEGVRNVAEKPFVFMEEQASVKGLGWMGGGIDELLDAMDGVKNSVEEGFVF